MIISQTEETSKEMNAFLIEIKLSINHSLFEKGYITEEMYTKAKEIIIKS
ncbi:MAG: hypothetical protein Q4G09_06000 [Clostridia bacterium]|nr:hypothetical protein [Clostridia bacterium]